jgi:hypothetical protein
MVACHKNHHVKCRRIVKMLTQRTSLSTYPHNYTNTIHHSYQCEDLKFYTVHQGSKIFPGARKVTRGRFHSEDPQIPCANEQNSGARDSCTSLYTINVRYGKGCVQIVTQRQLQKIRRLTKMKEPMHHLLNSASCFTNEHTKIES